MLDLINVRKTFNKGTINQRVALDGINLHLEDGDFVTVIGGNGAGKSTMLNMIAGVYPSLRKTSPSQCAAASAAGLAGA